MMRKLIRLSGLLIATVILLWQPAVDAAELSVAQNARDVTVDAQAGVAGVVPAGAVVPLRISIKSSRARRAYLIINWMSGSRSAEIELNADAVTTVDLAVPNTPMLDLSVNDRSGRSLANKSLELDVASDKTVVALGKSMLALGAPERAATVGGIQEATLVPLDSDLLSRPAALNIVSGVVLAPADVDSLDEATRTRLRQWVWAGGDLIIDATAAETLPVVDMPATGPASPVGAGWVRFSEGRLASGEWSQTLEPAVVKTRSDAPGAFMGFDGGFAGAFGGRQFAGVGPDFGLGQGVVGDTSEWSDVLIRVSFIPSWVVILAVFGTAFVAGPIAWYALRNRRARRRMWFVAPGVSLVVAGALLVSGQGVFSGSGTRVLAGVESTPWGSSGVVFSGLKETTTLEMPPGADMLVAQPNEVLSGSSDGRSARIDLARNAFGVVGVGPVALQEGPQIDVNAVAKADGLVSVTVTNRSTGHLRDVSVAGSSRQRKFAEIGPGASATLDFKTGTELWLFGKIFPVPENQIGWFGEAVNGTIGGPPESRGLIRINGYVHSSVKASSLSGKGSVAISATVPVSLPSEATDPDPRSPLVAATMRIDEVGGLTNEQLQMRLNDAGVFPVVNGIGQPVGPVPAAPTTVVIGNGSAIDPDTGEGGGEPNFAERAEYARVSFPGGRATAPCAVSVLAPNLEYWNGSQWAPLEKVGPTFHDDRVLDAMKNAAEMQDWMFPALDPGARLYLKISGRVFLGPPAMLFDCGERP